MDLPELPGEADGLPPGQYDLERKAGERMLDGGRLRSAAFQQWSGPDQPPVRIRLSAWAGSNQALHVMNSHTALRLPWADLHITAVPEKRILLGRGFSFAVSAHASPNKPVIEFWLTERAGANLIAMARFYAAMPPP